MKDGFNIGSRLLPSGVYESAGRATVSPYHAYRPWLVILWRCSIKRDIRVTDMLDNNQSKQRKTWNCRRKKYWTYQLAKGDSVPLKRVSWVSTMHSTDVAWWHMVRVLTPASYVLKGQNIVTDTGNINWHRMLGRSRDLLMPLYCICLSMNDWASWNEIFTHPKYMDPTEIGAPLGRSNEYVYRDAACLPSRTMIVKTENFSSCFTLGCDRAR